MIGFLSISCGYVDSSHAQAAHGSRCWCERVSVQKKERSLICKAALMDHPISDRPIASNMFRSIHDYSSLQEREKETTEVNHFIADDKMVSQMVLVSGKNCYKIKLGQYKRKTKLKKKSGYNNMLYVLKSIYKLSYRLFCRPRFSITAETTLKIS